MMECVPRYLIFSSLLPSSLEMSSSFCTTPIDSRTTFLSVSMLFKSLLLRFQWSLVFRFLEDRQYWRETMSLTTNTRLLPSAHTHLALPAKSCPLQEARDLWTWLTCPNCIFGHVPLIFSKTSLQYHQTRSPCGNLSYTHIIQSLFSRHRGLSCSLLCNLRHSLPCTFY